MNDIKKYKIFFKIVFFIYLVFIIISPIIIINDWNKIQENCFMLLLLFILLILFPILVTTLFYQTLIFVYRDKIPFKELTSDENELIEDARKLIHKVDFSIPSLNMKIYKVHSPLFRHKSWFYLDKTNNELCLFISFNKHLKYGKDICFMAIVHEMLHAYNLRNSISIFRNNFLEGLNHFFTLWLIENYSTKYHLPKKEKHTNIFTLRLFSFDFCFSKSSKFFIYDEQVEKVKQYLTKYNIDIQKCYLNYINMNVNFFKENLPEPIIYKINS